MPVIDEDSEAEDEVEDEAKVEVFDDKLVKQFLTVTRAVKKNVDKDIATSFLRSCGGDVNAAMAMFLQEWQARSTGESKLSATGDGEPKLSATGDGDTKTSGTAANDTKTSGTDGGSSTFLTDVSHQSCLASMHF